MLSCVKSFLKHPSLLLNKIFSKLTTRSNVFAVWCTVGFFEVNSYNPSTGQISLGQELNRAENKHIRHRMFAIIDRTALLSCFTTTAPASITATGTATVTPAAMSGTANTATGVSQSWSIQPGMILQVSGVGTTEQVVVKSVTGTTFTADFANTHSSTGNITITGYGNPGPTIQFNPHASAYSNVVVHYSIIE